MPPRPPCDPDLHLFGIRHHGPGSARALLEALDRLGPDIILVEGPPDADDLIPWLAHPDMEPPAALLVYRPDEPRRAGFFPFALFSPEYQALNYGLAQEIPVRFMDLPQRHLLAVPVAPLPPPADLFDRLARAAGRPTYERWWHEVVEQRQDRRALFEAILWLMTRLRQSDNDRPDGAAPEDPDRAGARRLADQREAAMRQGVRQARADGFRRLAVVCGAWHAPALARIDDGDQDARLLEGLPAVAVAAAWVPWTYGRLATRTGYGAGIASPGWYHHLWQTSGAGHSAQEADIRWLTAVARLLRADDLAAAPADVIEAARLAEALAALRGQPRPGLPELTEAAQAVLCAGEAAPLTLIRERLVIGERMGAVPDGVPLTPLQRDLFQQQRTLRLRPEPTPSVLTLDLRHARHRARSQLLNRLILLNIPWGSRVNLRAPQRTFSEVWRLQWRPELSLQVVEAGMWGNTVLEAATTYALHEAEQLTALPGLTRLLDQAILADLPAAVPAVLQRIEHEAAGSSDVPHMMGALAPLARILRYGDVRQTDQRLVRQVVEQLLTRICLGLARAGAELDDDAAAELGGLVNRVHGVVHTLNSQKQLAQWSRALIKLTDQAGVHGLLAGRACRLLLDSRAWARSDVRQRWERALSIRTLAGRSQAGLAQTAAWLQGFLQGSGQVLVHDDELWGLLDDWLLALQPERFLDVLPLLRRSFAGFSAAVRRQLGQRARFDRREDRPAAEPAPFDAEAAAAALPLLGRLLGVEP